MNKSSVKLASNWGGFAEFGVISEHEIDCECRPGGRHKVLPEDFDPAASTLIITWRETLSFICRMGVKKGSSVLILGSGANGLSFANHSANLGAENIVMLGSPSRKEDAFRVGVTDYIPYNSGNIPEKPGVRFNFIIDAVGKAGGLEQALAALEPGGRAAVYGIDDFDKINIEHPGYIDPGYDEGESHDTVIKQVREKLLRAENYCDLNRIFPLERINDAFKAVKNREMIKAVIKLQK